jgi:hypothetical protein
MNLSGRTCQVKNPNWQKRDSESLIYQKSYEPNRFLMNFYYDLNKYPNLDINLQTSLFYCKLYFLFIL